MALTDTKVRSEKLRKKEYPLVDGDGMFLLIHPTAQNTGGSAFVLVVSST